VVEKREGNMELKERLEEAIKAVEENALTVNEALEEIDEYILPLLVAEMAGR